MNNYISKIPSACWETFNKEAFWNLLGTSKIIRLNPNTKLLQNSGCQFPNEQLISRFLSPNAQYGDMQFNRPDKKILKMYPQKMNAKISSNHCKYQCKPKKCGLFFWGGQHIYIYIVVIHIYIYIDVINMISTDPYIDWIHKSMIYNNILLYSQRPFWPCSPVFSLTKALPKQGARLPHPGRFSRPGRLRPRTALKVTYDAEGRPTTHFPPLGGTKSYSETALYLDTSLQKLFRCIQNTTVQFLNTAATDLVTVAVLTCVDTWTVAVFSGSPKPVREGHDVQASAGSVHLWQCKMVQQVQKGLQTFGGIEMLGYLYFVLQRAGC